MSETVNMKEHFPFKLLLADLSDEGLKVEELGHTLDALTSLSRLVYSYFNGYGFRDLNVKK